ncbi:ABC-type nitrate/sulfonate/bicarbonate transport system ATPase subunit [Rubricella aquisinus]|uniref:ABC-type nitrate/sulfonate/bicarbonate transport system ATPase subunit n=1 Tax=Rubricella aquisinus TaxID=2028108 RepID=A0A840X8R3_9RHOB|nr:ABC transporter ATP-binding protein [Rubricella aquisinus]MBB5517117.1 ABC-type nitrate/sulfonate/bicarbonate transport system ATPase subunit [Rubricella aquisinus]
MSFLSLHDVDLSLGGTRILDAISLHVDKGEFVSILGPSGAGKSTIFRLLTGAVPLQGGTITCAGQPLHGQEASFAFMPQRDALLPWRRIIDNLTLGLEVQGIPRKDARARVTPLLADFGLEAFSTHYPAQLSGGMRQRAALLRTVVQGRAVQLLDEPFGALDALTRLQMQAWFEDRWRTSRWTTLLVTHDVREAVALSDRIYVLSPRPARVIAEMSVPLPRPRLGRPPCAAAHAIEAQLLETLLQQTGN